MRWIIASGFVLAIAWVGCTSSDGTSGQPLISGDTCAVHADQASCAADTACIWLATAQPCPPSGPCPGGYCESKTAGSGSGSGSASGSAACACPDGGVCYEQVGGPAQQGSGGPEVACTTPSPGSGDPCARIQGQGTCTDDPQVSGLCLCDNGIR